VKRALVLLLAMPSVAHAHLVSTGVGPFYDGIAHFFVSFEEILPVLALGLLAGLQGPRHGRWLIAILPLAWLSGAFLGLAWPKPPASPLPLIALLVVPGVLAAWGRALPIPVVAAVAGAFGFMVGHANGVTMAGWQEILGAGSAALVVATLVAAAVAALRVAWMRIAARVAASWLAALGILAAGWMLST
jgi:hydrogenase/urease accessory protein HupE